MANGPLKRTMGDYYRRTGVGKISLGCPRVHPMAFDIKNKYLEGLRKSQFDENNIVR